MQKVSKISHLLFLFSSFGSNYLQQITFSILYLSKSSFETWTPFDFNALDNPLTRLESVSGSTELCRLHEFIISAMFIVRSKLDPTAAGRRCSCFRVISSISERFDNVSGLSGVLI